MIKQDQALFTHNRFHNIGVGINKIQADVPRFAAEFLKAKAAGVSVDIAVLSKDPKVSDLGRFAVTTRFDKIGISKTSTLRNIAVTPPYMHDGSLKTLKTSSSSITTTAARAPAIHRSIPTSPAEFVRSI